LLEEIPGPLLELRLIYDDVQQGSMDNNGAAFCKSLLEIQDRCLELSFGASESSTRE
jgi:hypothetical protein